MAAKPKKNPKGGLTEINPEFLAGSVQIANVANVYIHTTEDKLRIALQTHRDCLESRWLWLGPAGIFVAVLTTILTVDFDSSQLVSGATLKIGFWTALLVSGIFTIVTGISAVRGWRAGGIEHLLASLKGESGR